MKEKIKKFFFRAFIIPSLPNKFGAIKNKKAIFAFLFFILAGISLFSIPISAKAGGTVEALKTLAVAPFIVIVIVFYYISDFILYKTTIAFSFLIKLLEKISYTKHEVVKAGLSITQGFTNMALVLILVFIALAIILRLKDYEMKKILPGTVHTFPLLYYLYYNFHLLRNLYLR